jgi:nucleolar GTP-binding protein
MKKKALGKVRFLDAEMLFENAMARARKEAMKISEKNKNKLIYAREKTRINLMADYITQKIDLYITSFPVVSELNEFQKESLACLIELKELKKKLGLLYKLNTIIKNIKKKNLSLIKKSSKPEKIRRICYGRILSLKKDIVETVNELNEIGRKLKEIPEIKLIPSIILAGFPNSGKTTILKRVTGSEPKIASYPFTTQKIELGYFTYSHKEIQVIDTPGLLDRKEEKRNPIEKKALNALKNLNGSILFVVDISEESHSIKEQKNLLKEIKKLNKKIIVALNKKDIATRKQIEKAKKEFNEFKVILTGENDRKLKEEIIRKQQ